MGTGTHLDAGLLKLRHLHDLLQQKYMHAATQLHARCNTLTCMMQQSYMHAAYSLHLLYNSTAPAVQVCR